MLGNSAEQAAQQLNAHLERTFAELNERTAQLTRESRRATYRGNRDDALSALDARVSTHESKLQRSFKLVDSVPSTGRMLECAFATAEAVDAALDALEATLSKRKAAAAGGSEEATEGVKSSLRAELQGGGGSDGDVDLAAFVGKREEKGEAKAKKKEIELAGTEDTPDRDVQKTVKKAASLAIPETPRAEDFGIDMDELSAAVNFGAGTAAFSQQLGGLHLDDDYSYTADAVDPAKNVDVTDNDALPEYDTPSVINQRHYGRHANDDDYTLDGDDTRGYSYSQFRNPMPNRELKFDEED